MVKLAYTLNEEGKGKTRKRALEEVLAIIRDKDAYFANPLARGPVLGPRGTVGPPYGPKDRGPLVLRAGGGTVGRACGCILCRSRPKDGGGWSSGRPPTVRWART